MMLPAPGEVECLAKQSSWLAEWARAWAHS